MPVAAAFPSQTYDCESLTNLESRVRRALRAGSYPCFQQIGCIVRDGVLILSGRVPSYYLKQVAQTIVRPHLTPAMVIDNQLSVGRMGDTTIQHR